MLPKNRLNPHVKLTGCNLGPAEAVIQALAPEDLACACGVVNDISHVCSFRFESP